MLFFCEIKKEPPPSQWRHETQMQTKVQFYLFVGKMLGNACDLKWRPKGNWLLLELIYSLFSASWSLGWPENPGLFCVCDRGRESCPGEPVLSLAALGQRTTGSTEEQLQRQESQQDGGQPDRSSDHFPHLPGLLSLLPLRGGHIISPKQFPGDYFRLKVERQVEDLSYSPQSLLVD